MAAGEVEEVSRREQAKEERRTRIVRAALELLREGDPNNITVSMIADRAGVNAMTVYNLFGTKAAVLVSVFDNDVRSFAKKVEASKSKDALDRIFNAVTAATKMYKANADFYRVMMNSTAALTDQGLARTTQASRTAFWRDALQRAIDEGHLRPDTDADLLSAVMIQVSAGAISQWGGGFITIDELDIETKYGFARLLLPSATRTATPRLKERLEKLSQAWHALPR